MKLRDFRVGWRLLIAEPTYSAVVIIGLAIGFAACFLLLGFVRYSFTYDAQVPDSGHVYVVQQNRTYLPRPEWQAIAPMPLRDALQKSGLPLIVSIGKSLDVAAHIDARILPLTMQAVDQNFAAMFGLKAQEGDLQKALSRPDSIALTVGSAQKLFGHAQALGKLVTIAGKPLRVDAILSDQPANTSIVFEALVGTASAAWPDFATNFDKWRAAGLYVRLEGNVAAATLLPLLQEALARSPGEVTMVGMMRRLGTLGDGAHPTELRIKPLSDLYFDPDLLSSRAGQQYGNRAGVLRLASIGLLILLLAATNYVNLATVRTLHRQREIGVRKVAGASAWRLAGQFIAESILVSLLATVLGLLLAWLLLPVFSELVNRKLDGLFTPAQFASGLLFGVEVGVLAAIYPAWIALRMRASETLHGRGTSETPQGLWIRRALTVFQFATAMGLTGTALAVGWQAHYASNADPGFDAAPLLVLELPNDANEASRHAFRDQVARLPGVTGTATSSEAVGRDGYKIITPVRRKDGATLPMEMKGVSPQFFEVYHVQAVFGRLFDSQRDRIGSKNVVLNASAATALGFASPQAALGQLVGEDADHTSTVIGIAPDLRYRTLRQLPEPMIYSLQENAVLTVRSASPDEALSSGIERLWKEHFPNDIVELQAASQLFAPNYDEDRRLAKTLAIAGVIASALAAFGIYVLSAYNVQRRAREIVLRKIYGASRGAIARMVGREFTLLVGVGALVGLPLATLAIERYLAQFIERAPMGIWPLLAAFGLATLIAFVASLRHTLVAMRVAPVIALRD